MTQNGTCLLNSISQPRPKQSEHWPKSQTFDTWVKYSRRPKHSFVDISNTNLYCFLLWQQDRERQAAIGRSAPLDPFNPKEANLPPSICISFDGEEGYIESQRSLFFVRQLCQIYRAEEMSAVFHPPPNKTICHISRWTLKLARRLVLSLSILVARPSWSTRDDPGNVIPVDIDCCYRRPDRFQMGQSYRSRTFVTQH